MTRPLISSSIRKSRIVSFRLSDADYAKIAYKAAIANLRVNEFARMAALSGNDTLHVKRIASIDPAFIKQLYHIGHNLNQLTKNAHIFGRISPQVETLAMRISEIMDEALAKGGSP